MRRSENDPLFWYGQSRRWLLTIDLRHWGFGVEFRKYWNVRVLCFEIGKN